MELHGLTNEEIIFIYKSNELKINTYNHIIEKKGMYNELEIPEVGFISVFRNMSDEDLDELLESPHFKICIQIQEKLEPIIEMIQETSPEEYERISKIFNDLEE